MDAEGFGDVRSFPGGPDFREALRPLELALRRHQAGVSGPPVRVIVDDGTEHELAPALFFRSERDQLGVDDAALELCAGRVLDVGAGGGALALRLQAAGHEVSAIDLLPGAAEVMRARGVRDVRVADVRAFQPDLPYDTVLALMNGAAAAGTLAGLGPWLAALARPLTPRGQILVDSTDLRERGWRGPRPDGRYVGELQYMLECEGERGPPFPQLFVDPERLVAAAGSRGLAADVVWRGRGGAYLARVTRT